MSVPPGPGRELRHGPTTGPDLVEPTSAVRPYTVTGGRTRPAQELAVETLVQGVRPLHALAGLRATLSPERRRILELTAGSYLSVAELSAHVELPLGVVRVLVGDLLDGGLVRVHGFAIPDQAPSVPSLRLLESVLDGISAL